MNKVHAAVIQHIRNASAEEGGKFAEHFGTLSDEQIVRMMFSNFRGRDNKARGLRLTNMGLELMKSYFRAYEIAMPEGHRVQSRETLYLDKRATLPYFFSNEKVVVFETELGVKLKLADGDINTLIEIETV